MAVAWKIAALCYGAIAIIAGCTVTDRDAGKYGNTWRVFVVLLLPAFCVLAIGKTIAQWIDWTFGGAL